MKTKLIMLTGVFTAVFLVTTFGLTKPLHNVHLNKGTNTEIGICTYVFTTNWEKVEFEVRAGNAGHCNDREFIGSYILYKGESMKLRAVNGLCWRRRADPRNPSSNWTNWTNSVMCTSGRTIKVSVR